MEFQKYTYTVKEINEDSKLTVIEKSGITADFKLSDFDANIIDMEKTLREITAKYNHEKLMKENVEEHHKFVLDLTAEQKHVLGVYLEACAVVEQYKPKIDEFEEALAIEKAEREYVLTTILNVKEN